VFASKNGTPLVERNLTRRILKPVGVKLGMPWLSRHVFRHSHSTFGEQIGVALSDRQAQMGHADVGMTLHYTHSDLERRRAAIATICASRKSRCFREDEVCSSSTESVVRC
jgi:integrase